MLAFCSSRFTAGCKVALYRVYADYYFQPYPGRFGLPERGILDKEQPTRNHRTYSRTQSNT